MSLSRFGGVRRRTYVVHDSGTLLHREGLYVGGMKAATGLCFVRLQSPTLPLAALGLMIAAASPAAAKSKTLPSGPPPADLCNTAGHRQFDFWVGKWDVYRSDTNQLVAHSLIEKLYAGCAVRENWMPLQGAGGGSLNLYRPKSREWIQVWTDNGNNLNEYRGRRSGAKMIMVGTSTSTVGGVVPVRVTYESRTDGSVVQTGYSAAGKGKPWRLTYELVYRRTSNQ